MRKIKELPEDLQSEYRRAMAVVMEAYHNAMRITMNNYEETCKEIYKARVKAEIELADDAFKKLEERTNAESK